MTHTRQAAAQRGIATLLILIFIGVALTVAVLGAVNHLRSGQEQSITFHSQTIAQARAWTAAELLREYLLHQASDWDTFKTALPGDMKLGELEGVAATLTLDPVNSNRVVALITARAAEGTRAESSSMLEVVYEISGGGPPPPGGAPSVITFNRNLRLSGNISLESDGAQSYEIYVKGYVTGSGNLSNISVLRATDSIELGRNVTMDFLHTDGDIKLSGNQTINDKLWARGNICVSGNAKAEGEIKANGWFASSGNKKYDAIWTIGQSDNTERLVYCSSPPPNDDGSPSPPARPYGVDIGGNSTVGLIRTKGGVRIGGNATVADLEAERELKVDNNSAKVTGTIGGKLNAGNNPHVIQTVNVVSGHKVNITPVPEVPRVDSKKFNAYEFEDLANYVFKLDDSGNPLVSVENIYGISKGDYSLSEIRTLLGIGAGCKTEYKSVNKTWEFSGNCNQPFRGILWFEGNVSVSNNGTYRNTYIATGNITVNGNLDAYAPNYAGNAACSGNYPTQLCTGSGNFTQPNPSARAAAIANYAFMAGSASGEDDPYVGGDVTLGGNATVYGSIMAGNDYITDGNKDIYGYITAQARRTVTGESAMSNNTNLKLKNLPPTYIPMGGIDWCVGCNPPSGNRTATIQWTRYH
ncbi:MAG: hypothetical protein WC997_06805 [Porticoccaceae bacterium]